ncbi:MAG: hypothetical protein REI64_11895 [Pedobacter sp.]|uniref:hypothetical protein n=2 Tax=Bacteroidota TaxID=976 RepID=UPI0028089798|nr:hypothetical protein [Pedobacter sp.]MDQ8005494.1 hypothetical protein [Pedobacter sp.]
MDTYLEKKAEEVARERSRILTIEVRDTGGYLVHVPDGKTMHSIKWNDISKVELSTDESKLLVYRSAVIDTIGANTHSGFLNLIKAIPDNIIMNDRLVSFKQNYFKDLSCCDICGKVSLKQGECLHCGNASYEQYVKNNKLMGITEDEGEREYIRREQLFWFYDEGGINFFDDYFLFEKCANWKPSVSKAEVVKYGAK